MDDLDPAARAVVARATGLVHDVLDDLGPALMARHGDVAMNRKLDGTPVTDIDLQIDEQLRDAVLGTFPDHGVLSEERDTVAPDTEWTWIVDPIDGTSNFTTGLPYWCISIALAHQGQPVLGVIDAPVLGRRYVGERGRGARRDGREMHVRPTVDWTDRTNRYLAVMLTTGGARRARDAGVRLNVRVMGSTALDLAMVAEGLAVASVATIPRVWDVAAGMVLVREAAGAVVGARGGPLLPLRPGVDHGQINAATAAAADADYALELAEALLADPQGPTRR